MLLLLLHRKTGKPPKGRSRFGDFSGNFLYESQNFFLFFYIKISSYGDMPDENDSGKLKKKTRNIHKLIFFINCLRFDHIDKVA